MQSNALVTYTGAMARTKQKAKQASKNADKARRRQRVQISVDRQVWARCQKMSDMLGHELSWSRVAEYSFITLLDQVDALVEQVYAKLRKDATPEEVAQAVRDYFNRQVHKLTGEVYAQIEQDMQGVDRPMPPPMEPAKPD